MIFSRLDKTELNLSQYGIKLWNIIKELNPYIVIDLNHFTEEKKEWCKDKLKTTNIITYNNINKLENKLETNIIIDYEDIEELDKTKRVFIKYTNINETLSEILKNI